MGRIGTGLGGLEERLRPCELSLAVAAREARELERRASGIAERVARGREQPEHVLDRLAETWAP